MIRVNSYVFTPFINVYWLLSKDAEFCYDLWYNDPKFVELFTIAETYADLLTMGADCYQEASDAYAELLIYALKEKKRSARYLDNSIDMVWLYALSGHECKEKCLKLIWKKEEYDEIYTFHCLCVFYCSG